VHRFLSPPFNISDHIQLFKILKIRVHAAKLSERRLWRAYIFASLSRSNPYTALITFSSRRLGAAMLKAENDGVARRS
jgi:hypothetical protein